MMRTRVLALRRTASVVLVAGAIGAGDFAGFAADVRLLRVRGAGGDSSLTAETIGGVAMLDARALVRLLGGSLDLGEADPVRFRVGTAVGEIYVGLPFFRADTTAWPLVAAPIRHAGSLYVPWQFATEILPKLASGLTFDAAARELRSAVPVVVAKARPASVARPPRRKVVVDAGHGGRDGGMRARLPDGSQVSEKTITLGIAQRLADALRKRGVEVVMTRKRDTLIDLADRGRIANKENADLFLSIHINAAGTGDRRPLAVRGFETYFLAEAQTEDERRVEAMENESTKYDATPSAAEDDPLSFILHDMRQNAHLRESSELASALQFGLLGTHPGPNRGVKQANFAVLRHSYMPAVLIEAGYGSNATEAYWLSSVTGQRALAQSIADATLQYLHGYEARLNASRSQ